jgi:hypothetical protein
MRNRTVIFVLWCVVATALPIVYVTWSRLPTRSVGQIDAVQEINDPTQLAAVRSRAHVLFINKQPGPGFGRIALAPLDALGGPRYLTPLECEHVYFAGGFGLCLSTDRRLMSTYFAYTFGSDFTIGARIPLQGYPSRVRVSPDGRMGAITVFIRGDSYAAGGFSTRTTLVEIATGRQIGDLEQYAAFRTAELFKAPDFNYWGVTFSTSVPGRFYATLATGGRPYLVEGSVERRNVRTIFDNVECPSLSPDDAHIVFKRKRENTAGSQWALRVLALERFTDVELPESRSVDDQATWLDADHILYSLPHGVGDLAAAGSTNLWSIGAAGIEPPQLFLRHAYSPAIVGALGKPSGT